MIPANVGRKSRSISQRFEALYMPEPNTGCWLWLGDCTAPLGVDRPRFWLNGKRVSAHRFSFQHFNGPIPEGLLVCHRCNTPMCVNPDHLYAGTHKDNSADMMRAGRHVSQITPNFTALMVERLRPSVERRRAATHCKRGHPLEGHNLVIGTDGGRGCRTCRQTLQRGYARIKRAKLRSAR